MTHQDTHRDPLSRRTADSGLFVPCPPIVTHYDLQDRHSPRTISSPENNLLVAELTRRCNLHCVHCYADAGPKVLDDGFMTLDRWKSVFEWGRRLGYQNLQFIGGEATLHPDFAVLLTSGRNHGFDVEVFSNGVSQSKKIRSAIENIRPKMAFSLYSASPESHDEVTKIKGSFRRTWDTLAWCLDRDLTVRVAMIAVNENCDGFVRMRERLEDLGVRNVTVHDVQPIGRGANHAPTNVQRPELCGMCGEGMICITAAGDVYPCVFSRIAPLGRVGEGVYWDMLVDL